MKSPHLPNEIIAVICADLSTRDICSARLINKAFADCGGTFLFRKLVFNASEEGYIRTQRLGQHETLRHHVTTLVWRINVSKVPDMIPADARASGFYGRTMAEKERLGTRNGTHGKSRRKEPSQMEQESLTRLFGSLMERFDNLKKIVILTYNRVLYKPEHKHHKLWYDTSLGPWGNTLAPQRGCHDRLWGIQMHPDDAASHPPTAAFFAILQSVPLAVMDLAFPSETPFDRAVVAKLTGLDLKLDVPGQASLMKEFLLQFTNLKHLNITAGFYYSLRERNMCFDDIFPTHQAWPRLESLGLKSFNTNGQAFVDFLASHAVSLRSLTLGDIKVRSSQFGAWKRIAHTLQPLFRLTDAKIISPIVEGYRGWDDQAILDDFAEYLVRGGYFPLNESNATWIQR
ncbi:hypothetical protein P154DRAFT_577754 [Amniculicola lignicola CBS 123094]|uniref:F-box domain-containing protein n=1 Tax=Amniculicola lignicola CBS 123094 TaxID=1392246 RepID=A0A6A5WBZ8_9PLEO|nr:hypothetical protein P154DRAFT_577754 [Amniculicola lignicola CBS 123094]